MFKRRVGLLLAVCGLITLAGAPASASAETPAPWWGVTTGAQPTNLSGSSGKDEVQRLTITATKGDYLVGNSETYIRQLIELIEEKRTTAQFTAGTVLPFDASAAQVREALEKAFPGRLIQVAAEPSNEEHTRVFTITFPNQAVKPMLTENGGLAQSFLGAEPLELEGGTAKLEGVEPQAGVDTQNRIVMAAQNLGNASTSGEITIADHLPPGLHPVAVEAHAGGTAGFDRGTVNCLPQTLTCTFAGVLPAFEQIEARILVTVDPTATAGEQNTATVSGGGAASVTRSHPLEIDSPQRFGVEDYSLVPESFGGAIDTQAGSHPFQLTTVVTLNTTTPNEEGDPVTVAMQKDIAAELPPGLIGNPTPFAQCTDAQFGTQVNEAQEFNGGQKSTQLLNACSAASAIGVATVTVHEPSFLRHATLSAPIFNMVPRPGEPARFGFKVAGIVAAFLDTKVRTGGDYGVTVSALNLPQIAYVTSAKLTFWGTPGAPAHDNQRGWDCLLQLGGPAACPATNPSAPPPFVIMPSSCQAPFSSTVRADSWAASGKPSETADPVTYDLPEAVDGCNQLPFAPEVRVTPDGTAGSTPTGLNVDVHVPQDSILHSESLAESAVKDITVALPPGVAVNPAGSDGLAACSTGLAGFTGFTEPEPGSRTAGFTPALPEPLAPGSNFCPDASKIGTVDIASPLLPAGQHLKGSVYLAAQNENPFGSLIALYIIAKDPVSGVIVKLPGETHLTEGGQIITTFKNTPQLAFEDAELHFFGGERAPLATPARCGPYTTNASFTPWSGSEPATASSTFNITSGPNGSPCPGATLPFSPSLTGGSTDINAGAFSPFTMTMSRPDDQQALQGIQLHMPAGLEGLLTGVTLCGEADANAGTCGPGSLIGEDTVSAGLGNDPITVPGAKIYITGPYHGAPFGLSIVNPAKAGPFDLERDTSNPAQNPACDCVVDRARIDVDPHTANLTVTTNSPAEGYAIPNMIDGVPLQLKHINVTINRPNFTFNPTNCNPLSLTGLISADEGASSPVSVPFQATNCKNLLFHPKFTVSTQANGTAGGHGASLDVKIAAKQGPGVKAGEEEANIHKADVSLPEALSSRLTTLNKACTEVQFVANPAGCPGASDVGYAVVHTPVLPVPLEGPAYLVSHGGAAFPDLVLVLQGDGVRVDLTGNTQIKKGITYSRFETAPDAPVSSFELKLPEGKFSILGAIKNLCKPTKTVKVKKNGKKVSKQVAEALIMPTSITAQNGAVLTQSTKIAVTGCKKARKAKKAKKHNKKGKGKKK